MATISELAPNFKAKALVNGDLKEISLSDFRGKKLALYFYPKDLTPGCTTQAENLRDNYNILEEKGITILGLSFDSIDSHKKFSEKKDLPFILISDSEKTIANLYGAYGEKSFMGKKYMGIIRKTFLIDENGKIVSIIEKPIVKDHAREILEGFKIS